MGYNKFWLSTIPGRSKHILVHRPQESFSQIQKFFIVLWDFEVSLQREPVHFLFYGNWVKNCHWKIPFHRKLFPSVKRCTIIKVCDWSKSFTLSNNYELYCTSLSLSLNQTMVLYLNKYIHPFINHYDLLYANPINSTQCFF